MVILSMVILEGEKESVVMVTQHGADESNKVVSRERTRTEMIAFCTQQAEATSEKGAKGEYATYVDLRKNFIEDTTDTNWSSRYKFILRSYFLAYCSGEIKLSPDYPPLLVQVRKERCTATLHTCDFANIHFDSSGRVLSCSQ